jgi:hypothetical protein
MNASAAAPEHWCVRTTDTNVVVLTIPGHLSRTRSFDVDVQLRVRLPVASRRPELGLSLEIDGSLQWSRTIAGSVPLEYHCRLRLEPGRDSRLRARATARQCALVSLSLSAVEERG